MLDEAVWNQTWTIGVRDEKVSCLVYFQMSQATRILYYFLEDKYIVIQTFSY